MMVTNEQFLRGIFGDDYIWAHVTDFVYDPGDIPKDKHLIAWKGDYYSRYALQPNTNQFYTISTFYPDEEGTARRRKALFRATHVIVADDVREKLPVERLEMLPPPSFKLESSPGSEQWGWILDWPCTDRLRVENLLDGLVAQGLAPDGRDPGMKGCTRYVRLPEGVNTKAKRVAANGGVAPGCRLLEWYPERKVSLEALAAPFGVDLDAERRETRVDGAADVGDHPILQLSDIIHVKEVRSDGRFDITCPWVGEHTGQDDSGSAVFTNADGTIGFKCFHGGCQDRTGVDLLRFIDAKRPGFTANLKSWQVLRSLGAAAGSGSAPVTVPTSSLSFLGADPAPGHTATGDQGSGAVPDARSVSPSGAAPMEVSADAGIGYQQLIDTLKRMPPPAPATVQFAYEVLRAVDDLDHGNRLQWWNAVRDHMQWTKPDLIQIITAQRDIWYPKNEGAGDYAAGFVYIGETNQFYNPHKRLWLTCEAFQNAHNHLDPEARLNALVNGGARKADRIDYAPGLPETFEEDGISYANSWIERPLQQVQGAVDRWLGHFDVLGWAEHKTHVLKWFAYTLRNPERKINHALVLGGPEGNGKDFILYPMAQAMGKDSKVIAGDALLETHNPWLMATKHLHINEVELGDRTGARAITNKLKPLTAGPPDQLTVNIKNVSQFDVRNIVNVTMSTNSATPVRLDGDSRRYYAMWSDVTIRDPETGDMSDEWRVYWEDRWNWMRDCEGWKCCVWYLMNCVDISDFNPGSVPVVTDFVRDIQQASEDPIVTLIKQLTRERIGLFQCDLLQASDIRAVLSTDPRIIPMMGDIKVPIVNTIGKILKQHHLGIQLRARGNGVDCRVWALRDREKYRGMQEKDLLTEYERGMSEAKRTMQLQLAKGA